MISLSFLITKVNHYPPALQGSPPLMSALILMVNALSILFPEVTTSSSLYNWGDLPSILNTGVHPTLMITAILGVTPLLLIFGRG